MQLNDPLLQLSEQMQEVTVRVPQQVDCDRLLATMALRIRKSLNLEEILNTAVAEVRQFLQTDRVIIYRFQPDWSGVVVVESVNSSWLPTLGVPIQDTCFAQTYLQPYKQGRIRIIEDIYTENIAQCHVELLARFQVRANLVVPILQGENLWGLLIAHHCSGPRRWQQWEVDLLEQLATHMAIAIQQSELYLQAQSELLERKRVEFALQKAKDELEIKVEQRTSELKNTNKQLQSEIVERKRIEAALRVSEERYALAVRGAKDGLWDWNLKTNQVYFSSRWRAMLGYEDSEVNNTPEEWFNYVHPEDIERVKVEIAMHLEGIAPHFESEYRMLHKDGTYRWILSRGLAVRDVNGKAYRLSGCQTDITERKVAQEQLLHDAFHDALTGLPNRALFMDRLGHTVERAKRHQDYLFAVLFVDLDRFKVVNDSLGHLSGDRLLVAVVQRLERCLRAGDTVARLGGDEFAILLEDIKDISDATGVAERIQTELTVPFNLSGHEVFTTASIGIVLSTTGYERLEDLLRDADIAMYRAKAQGKACHQVFDKAMHIKAVTLLQLENDLRRAIVCAQSRVDSEAKLPEVFPQQFQVHYQPIVSLATGTIKGFEALARWQHPTEGFISPAQFIPVAEETGLIVPLGYWILREACRQTRQWQEQFPTNPPLTISVNLSSKQVSQPDLIEQIERILRQTDFNASNLRLEITESAIMENAEAAAAMLIQLRILGIELYVDDFGTGYSSLSYLQRFPVNALKIDRSFVSNMGVKGEDSDIVQTIVMLARKLGIDVVAEGVETAEQLAHLKQLGCTDGQGQGYFFSKPLNSVAAGLLIAEKPQW